MSRVKFLLPAVFTALVVSPSLYAAQPSELEPVPGNLPVQERQALLQRKSALEAQKKALAAKARVHNQKCGKVPAGTALENECRLKMGRLRADISAYSKLFKRYNQEVRQILAVLRKARQEVAREQQEFKRRYTQWLHKRHQQVREAVRKGKGWANAVLEAIKRNRVPESALRPKSLKELQPGDILLVEPAEGKSGRTSRLIRITDHFITGRAFKFDKNLGPASHALTYIGRAPSGRALFLDNTPTSGSHIIGETEFLQTYGSRRQYVARIQAKVDGRKILRVALGAAQNAKKGKRLGSDYGVLGKDAVCSERAAFAVAKASGMSLKEHHLGYVDITPGDFFDKESVGKYFILSPLKQ